MADRHNDMYMLKTVMTKQIKLGMYIHELKGAAWVDHPFWKTRFVIQDVNDLKKLKASVVKQVVIDTDKGLDVDAKKVAEEVKDDVAPEAPAEKCIEKKTSFSEECKAAKRAIDASKQAVTSMFNDVRMGKAIDASAAMPLVEDIASSVTRNENTLISLVRLKTKDDYTYMHSVAVCALMVALAKQLNLSEGETRQAGLAGLMHDIGKAAIPNEVLNKPGALTDEEFNLVKLHPERGHALLLQGGIQNEAVLEVCLRHHEKMDGSGYPGKLAGDQISLLAKMGAVCDVYDAVTSDRPYKAGWDPGTSLKRMAQWKGHFDPKVFEAFVKSVGIYPVGTVVLMKSGKLGVVIDQSKTTLLKPVVKVFFSTKSQSRIPVKVLDLSKQDTQDAIQGVEEAEKWGVDDVDALWSEPDA